MRFTADQLQAIDTNQSHLDACVTAGPGSGKTTVLVEYFRRLVESGVHPQRILAITFTEKAAANMREKLAAAFADNDETRASLERGWVSTVHGFCARLLRENAVFAGVDPDFYIADERESWRLQQEAIADALCAVFAELPEAVRALIRGLASREFDTLALSAYDAMRGAGMTLEEVAAMPPPPDTAPDELAAIYAALKADPLSGSNPAQRIHVRAICGDLERILHAPGPLEALQAIEAYSGKAGQVKNGTAARQLVSGLKDLLNRLRYTYITAFYCGERQTLLEILRRFDRLYRERKNALGALDFADLEEYAVRLLEENPEIRSAVQRQFDHILMDEFQDTNGQQSRLIKLLRCGGRFYAVGDVNQSIYGFRHAEPQVFRDYRSTVQQGSRRLIDLAENFRSRADILRAVETIAGHAEGVEPRLLIPGKEFAKPRPVAVELMGVLGPDAESALETEARWVARRIAELVSADPPFRFQDIAVLVRNSEVISQFAAGFDEAGIPYVVNRGKGFFEAREVRDLYHLLRIIANPRDEVSLAAVLRSPLVHASDESLLALRLQGNLGESLARLSARPEALPPEEYEKLVRFRDRLHEWRTRRASVSFDRILLEAIDDCGYRAHSWTNIEKFLAQARAAATRMPVDEFVESVSRFRGDDIREPEAPPEDATDTVNIMTAHSAKGLEFPVVFVAALHKGTLNQTPTLAFSRNYGLGARWRNPATGEEKNDLYQHAIHEERKQREREEANRLLYVAMTRAEEHLVLSFSAGGRKPENWAKTILAQLPGVAVETPCEEILTLASPRGEEWKLRVFLTDQQPERLPLAAIAGTQDEVEWLEPPVSSEAHDANATVTAVAAFAACPRRYYLAHYLGFEGRASGPQKSGPRKNETRTGSRSAGEFGSLVHALLAGKPLDNPDPQAAAMAATFQQSALGRRLARASRIEREFDFLMSVEGVVLRGQIDLWFEEGGELVLVDYKTDAVSAVEAHQRAQEYAIQVRLYALAVEQIAGRPPDRAWLHFLRPNVLIPVDLTPSLLDSPEQMVRDLREAQAKQQFPLREGEHCTRCSFFRGLCASQYKA
ncbi:MAG TPA: UvrD-helicase domain-containing protein [Bryobacteraceae bacterium]|nr:UvrD-helicase domain-containing protein [Bryobacteraceae bacterium]